MLADLTSRVRGVLEELNQFAGQRTLILLCLLLRGGEGAAYLAGNLALAYDGGLQAGGDRQQVADGVLSLVQVEAVGNECGINPERPEMLEVIMSRTVGRCAAMGSWTYISRRLQVARTTEPVYAQLAGVVAERTSGMPEAPALRAATVVKSTVWCDATNA